MRLFLQILPWNTIYHCVVPSPLTVMRLPQTVKTSKATVLTRRVGCARLLATRETVRRHVAYAVATPLTRKLGTLTARTRCATVMRSRAGHAIGVIGKTAARKAAIFVEY